MNKGNLLILALIGVLLGIIVMSLIPAPDGPDPVTVAQTPALPAAPAAEVERYPIATAASVAESGAVSASFHVPGGSFVAKAPTSHSVGAADSTSTAPEAFPSLPGITAKSPAAPASPSDSSQPRLTALCSFSHERHCGAATNCTGSEEVARSTNGSAMDMLTKL